MTRSWILGVALIGASLPGCGKAALDARPAPGAALSARGGVGGAGLFVKLAGDVSGAEASRLFAAHGLTDATDEQPMLAKLGWRWLRQRGLRAGLAATRERLLAAPGIADVALDEVFARPEGETPGPPSAPALRVASYNDPLVGQAWAVRKLELAAAHVVTMSSPRLLVAVLDSGVDWDHPDLATAEGVSRVVRGRDTLGNTDQPRDGSGHGTHAAGIVGATANNGRGIVGVAPRCRILAEKVVSDHGYGDVASVAAGIVHAADQGAQVISMSLGSPTPNPVVRDAVLYAQGKDALLVAAMGNSGHEDILYPAAFPGVVAVGATREDDTRARFSSFGAWISVAAPGDNIVSTVPTFASEHPVRDYGWMSGTSMATPHVAGLAALLRDLHPEWPASRVKQRIEETARPLGGSAFNPYFGHGRIEPARAVRP
jgi:thermitase